MARRIASVIHSPADLYVPGTRSTERRPALVGDEDQNEHQADSKDLKNGQNQVLKFESRHIGPSRK